MTSISIGAAKRHGSKFAYHNHGLRTDAEQGQSAQIDPARGRNPRLVMFFEMEIYWTTAGWRGSCSR